MFLYSVHFVHYTLNYVHRTLLGMYEVHRTEQYYFPISPHVTLIIPLDL